MLSWFSNLILTGRDYVLAADPVWLAGLLVLATAWLGGAFWGAEVAERRWRSPLPYLLLGLVVPGLGWWLVSRGPCHAPVILTPEEVAAHQQARLKWHESGVPATADPASLPLPEVPAVGARSAVYAAFFLNLQQGARVSETYPLYVRYNGNDLLAHAVVEVQDKLVVLDMQQEDGGAARLRVPYAKIEEVKWLKHV
ncbi:MAG: hypothetical protein WCH61_02295 [bacterium]